MGAADPGTAAGETATPASSLARMSCGISGSDSARPLTAAASAAWDASACCSSNCTWRSSACCLTTCVQHRRMSALIQEGNLTHQHHSGRWNKLLQLHLVLQHSLTTCSWQRCSYTLADFSNQLL